MKIYRAIVLGAFSLIFAGCGSTSSTPRYPISSTGMAKDLDSGMIVDIRPVIIDGTSSGIGSYGGAIAGSAIGGTVVSDLSGTSLGGAVGAAGGMIAGAVVGPKIEKSLTSKKAQEITVQLDEGGTIVVVQELREPRFNIGDPVRVDSNLAGAARIYHAHENPGVDPDTGAYLPEDFDTSKESELE